MPPTVGCGDLLELERELLFLRQLDEAGAVEQNEIYHRASEDYKQFETDAAKLRLALVLSTPGKPHTDMDRARKLMAEVQASPQPPPRAVQDLLRLRVAEMERYKRAQDELSETQAKIKALTEIEQKVRRK